MEPVVRLGNEGIRALWWNRVRLGPRYTRQWRTGHSWAARALIAVACALGALLPGSWSAVARPLGVTSVSLTASLPSGQSVGTAVTLTATSAGGPSPVYRFSIGPAGAPLAVVRDFAPTNTFTWVPIDEGTYDLEVTSKDGFGALTSTDTLLRSYAVRSRVTGGTAVVSATAHPLVALYSAPPCTSGQMHVDFRPVGGQNWQSTNWKPCVTGASRNFLVAGMRAATTYELRHVVASGSTVQVSPLTLRFTTGTVPASFPSTSVPDSIDGQTSLGDDVLVRILAPTGALSPRNLATDLAGRLLWYYGDAAQATGTRLLAGGSLLVITGDGTPGGAAQTLREVDLAGNVLHETNVARLNEQLDALRQDHVNSLHHEATRFPNGNTLVLGYVERLLSDVQGASGPVDVLGAMVLALDANWQVTWVWNTFDHLDVNRRAILGEQCSLAMGAAFCPLQRADVANDWIHANALGYSPTDGDLLLSMRNQDWVIKINYRDGAGSGDVLWRLGKDGDFTAVSDDPSPWFSHQHDATYAANGLITLFDNGTTRCAVATTACHSRGQALQVDEGRRQVTWALNADLGSFSDAWGSAERLSNGNYHFTSGKIPTGSGLVGQSIEVLPAGTVDYVQQVAAGVYRSYRTRSLYVS